MAVTQAEAVLTAGTDMEPYINTRRANVGGHDIVITVNVGYGNMNDKVGALLIKVIDEAYDNLRISQTGVELRDYCDD